MTPEQKTKVRAFIEDIRAKLPDVHKEMEDCLDEFDGFAPTKMFERFCELTNKAMRERDELNLNRYLRYMSQKLVFSDGIDFEMIDVYYVESLMWNVPESESRWAWKQFPENIRELYTNMWSGPRF